ncbi:unnamed protein product [Absidia cylindrospora]
MGYLWSLIMDDMDYDNFGSRIRHSSSLNSLVLASMKQPTIQYVTFSPQNSSPLSTVTKNARSGYTSQSQLFTAINRAIPFPWRIIENRQNNNSSPTCFSTK